MTSELQKRLRALREIAPRLNSAADEANRIVKMVDSLLDEMHLGISSESGCFETRREQLVDEHDGSITDQETCRCLAYGRIQGSYAVHLLEIISQAPQGRELEQVDENRIPWSACDRESRLAAFKELPNLLDGLLREASSVVRTAELTAETIRGITEGEDANSPPPLPVANWVVERDGIQMLILPVVENRKGLRDRKHRFQCFVSSDPLPSGKGTSSQDRILLPVPDSDGNLFFATREQAEEAGFAAGELWLKGKV